MDHDKIDPLAVTLEDAAKALGITKSTLRALAVSGEVPSFFIGRRRLISVAALQEYVAKASDVKP